MAQGQKPKFVPDRRPLIGKPGGEPPTWAVVVLVAIFFGIGAIAEVAEWSGSLRGWLPYGYTEYFWISLIFLPMVALIVLAAISKLFELHKAKGWSQTTGRIVRSTIEARHHRFGDEAETVKNQPAIEYEFTANGRQVHGSRIGIGDDSGGENTEATLARYPVGATVAVFYDSNDPTNCVLERAGPQGVTASGCVLALAELAAVGVAVWWLVTRGPAFVSAHFPKAEAELAVFAFGFGLFVLWFFVAYRRYLKRAQAWPSVTGTIVKSGVESYREIIGKSQSTLYRPALEYSYLVHGHEYRGNQIKLGLAVSGNETYAQKVAGKYREGERVEVHYDPANPGNAALENPTGASWFPLGIAVLCFAFAAYLLGIFK